MNACQWCGLGHSGRCPLVKAIEYHENGTIKRVEFVTNSPQATSGHEPALFERIFGPSIFR